MLYGIETGTTEVHRNRATLFSLDPNTLKRTVIKQLGKDLIPAGGFNRRFSLTTDGKSMTYSIDKERDDLWLLTGYRQPGLWNQIKETLHLN